MFTISYILYTLHSLLYPGAQDMSPLEPPPSTSLIQNSFSARREAKYKPDGDGRVQKSESEQTHKDRFFGVIGQDGTGIDKAKKQVGNYAENLKEGNWNSMGDNTKDILANHASSLTMVPQSYYEGMNTTAIVWIIIAQVLLAILLELVVGYILYLIWKQNCMYRKRIAYQATREKLKGDLAPTGLFGCFSFTVHHMIESILCGWCVMTENQEKEKPPELREKEIPFSSVCLNACLGKITCAVGDTCLWFCFCCPFYGFYGTCCNLAQRLRLSKLPADVRTKSKTGCCAECVQTYICTAPCAQMQVAEFLEHHDKHFAGDPDETAPLKPDGLRW